MYGVCAHICFATVFRIGNSGVEEGVEVREITARSNRFKNSSAIKQIIVSALVLYRNVQRVSKR